MLRKCLKSKIKWKCPKSTKQWGKNHNKNFMDFPDDAMQGHGFHPCPGRFPIPRVGRATPRLHHGRGACTPGACALGPEKPLLWEARAPHLRKSWAPPRRSAARNEALTSSSGVGSFIIPIFIHSSVCLEWPRLENTVLFWGYTLVWFGFLFPSI